ncbi:ABC transporter permease [Pseudodesulfovibrio sp.]|uniref:ABC transporter permease n=1 Tax=Pseudodesulfovibrio sp. TaxID=2035812 RepID=UPI00260355BD|nr:ABC transporter permease [Pseudodesulfovibrio sp.]MDD3311415.1 ABC transporter permease [Pseudodesulfovibrio sp.]
MNRRLLNVYNLGIKELRSLWRDKVMLLLILWVFTGGIYTVSKAASQELHNAPIAVVDHDRSVLSERIVQSFYGPYFLPAERIDAAKEDAGLDAGRYIFVLDVPPDFEKDVLAGREPDVQVNIDATSMSQAFIGAGYIQNIVLGEVNAFVAGKRESADPVIATEAHVKFNPNLISFWFGSVMELINNITMLSIILTGAAVVREREYGTLEHLLVMPVDAIEIMLAKVWSMSLVVLAATAMSLELVVKGVLGVPVAGAVPLFLLGALLQLFATSSIGIFLGTVARNMPQLGLIMILVILPLELLSGGVTPRESMPRAVQMVMEVAPTTHFVALAQAILYRGAGFSIVWPRLLAILAISVGFFAAALSLFRKSLARSSG